MTEPSCTCTSSPWWIVKTTTTLGLAGLIAIACWCGNWMPHAMQWPGQLLVLAGFGIHLFHARRFRRHQAQEGSPRLLTCAGWFMRIRHPMYLAEGMIGAGMALILLSAWGGILLALQWTALWFQALKEDEAMGRQFGDRFQQWKKKTGLLFPPLFR